MPPQYGELDSRDVIADFFPAFERSAGQGFAPRIAMMVPSTRETEEYDWPGHAAGLREWVGGRLSKPPKKYEMTLRNRPYEDTMDIPVADLRRDKTGFLRRRAAEMGTKAGQHWDTLLSAEMETNNNSYDGQGFFDTDHDESGTNQTNALTNTQVPAADVTSTAAPTADEAADIITQTVGYATKITDDQGDPINGDARNWMIMIGGDNQAAIWGAFMRAISADRLASGASNLVPALGMTFEVVANPRLTSTSDTHVYFFRLDAPLAPYILQDEEPLTTQLIGAGSEYEFENDAHRFGLKATRAVGPGAWTAAFRVTLS